MGVIYKVTEELKQSISDLKKQNPGLSARKISATLSQRFNKPISKSTVNNIIKQLNLSSPVGRRRKGAPVPPLPEIRPEIKPEPPKPPQESELNMGLYLLKAIENTLGGVDYITNLLQETTAENAPGNIRALVETLLYIPLFGDVNDYESNSYIKETFERLTGAGIDYGGLVSYLEQLQYNTAINFRLYKELMPRIREVQYLKFVLSDDSLIYIDASARTIWPYGNIPSDFYATYYNTEIYIKNTFINKTEPFVIFIAPLASKMPQGLLDFIGCCKFPSHLYVKNISFFTSGREEISSACEIPRLKTDFIIGLPEGQYASEIALEDKKEGSFFRPGPDLEEIVLSEGTAQFTQHKLNQLVTLRAIFIKKASRDRHYLVLLTDMDKESLSKEDVARAYLNKWPDFKDALDDFNKRIEFFSFGLKNVFSTEETRKQGERGYIPEALSFESVLKAWRWGLIKYCVTHLLPIGYDKIALNDITERVFKLRGRSIQQDKYNLIKFQPQGHTNDIAYLSKRANELNSVDKTGHRFWFSQ